MKRQDDILLRDPSYKSGSELELQSVKDVLSISRCSLEEIAEKTSMSREKVLQCLKMLAARNLLAKQKSKYFLLADG